MSAPSAAELAEFVRESNAIEGIYALSGEPLYDDHLDAAEQCAKWPLAPGPIHAVLMASEPDKRPGQYRRVDVGVGGQHKMHWARVPMAMGRLLMKVGKLGDNEAWCWNMHHEFEHIHPFIDGNGRTGRLWMNALRLACGLPWLTIYERDRQAYYRRIVEWEKAHA